MRDIKRVISVTILALFLVCSVGISISFADNNIFGKMIQKIEQIKGSQNDQGQFAGIYGSTLRGYVVSTSGPILVDTYPFGDYITRTQVNSICQEEGWSLVYTSSDFDLIVCPNVLEEAGDGLIMVWYDSQDRASEIILTNKMLPQS